jgi:hypothetical protein
MASIVRYSTSSTPNPVTDYLPSVNTPDYEGQANVLVNPDLSAVSGQPLKYWKHVAGAIQLMTQGERDAADAAIAAALLLSQRAGAKDIFDGSGSDAKILKAVVLLLIDELNALRERDRDRSTDVAAATNLADLKARWAARSALADRTGAQARTAIRAKLDNGDAD